MIYIHKVYKYVRSNLQKFYYFITTMNVCKYTVVFAKPRLFVNCYN